MQKALIKVINGCNGNGNVKFQTTLELPESLPCEEVLRQAKEALPKLKHNYCCIDRLVIEFGGLKLSEAYYAPKEDI